MFGESLNVVDGERKTDDAFVTLDDEAVSRGRGDLGLESQRLSSLTLVDGVW